MLKLLTTIIFCILMFNVNAQFKRKCSDFYTGTFYVEGDRETIIKRTKTKQIEKNSTTKTKDRVVWTSSCSYKLVPTKIIKDERGIIQDWVLFFEIVETGDDFYVVRVTNDNNEQAVVVKVFKV